jgi:biotin-(acetyl-CoA carboxylase) ligase
VDLIAALERWIELHLELGVAPIAAAWRERSSTLGRRVTSTEGVGWARDIDDDGALRLELDDGRTVAVRSGEVS